MFSFNCPLSNFSSFLLEYCKASSSLLASSCFSWDFLFNAFPFDNNSKFLFFSASSEHLRNSAWKYLLLSMLWAIEAFSFSIFLSMMANWAHCAFCFRKDSFSLTNSWYLCREHLTDFNRLFVIGDDCGKRLTVYMVNDQFKGSNNISCMLTLRTWPWLNTSTSLKIDERVL